MKTNPLKAGLSTEPPVGFRGVTCKMVRERVAEVLNQRLQATQQRLLECFVANKLSPVPAS